MLETDSEQLQSRCMSHSSCFKVFFFKSRASGGNALPVQTNSFIEKMLGGNGVLHAMARTLHAAAATRSTCS
jgi:hypothetical protein